MLWEGLIQSAERLKGQRVGSPKEEGGLPADRSTEILPGFSDFGLKMIDSVPSRLSACPAEPHNQVSHFFKISDLSVSIHLYIYIHLHL